MRALEVECISCLKSNCILKCCSSSSLKEIEEFRKVEHYSQGQSIIMEGTPMRGIYIIHSGKVKVFRAGNNSKVQIIRLAGSGEIIGHRSLGQKQYSVSATALEDTCVMLLEADFFTRLLKKDALLTYNMMMFYCTELQKSEARLKNLAQMSVREKVLESLIMVGDVFGVRTADGILLDVELSRNDYGELSSLRSEQFIKIISELKDEGLLKMRNDKKIILTDVRKMRRNIAAYSALSE